MKNVIPLTMTILKVKTSGATAFLIDTDDNIFMRVRGEGSSTFWHDHQWKRSVNILHPVVGSRMPIDFNRMSEGWHLTSAVTEITELTKDEANAFIKEHIENSEPLLFLT